MEKSQIMTDSLYTFLYGAPIGDLVDQSIGFFDSLLVGARAAILVCDRPLAPIKFR